MSAPSQLPDNFSPVECPTRSSVRTKKQLASPTAVISCVRKIRGPFGVQLNETGGCFVLIDLSLDIVPFTKREKKMFGANIDIRWVVSLAPFSIVEGVPSRLYGFPEFDRDLIQSNLSSHLIGRGYTTLVQCLVLQRPVVAST